MEFIRKARKAIAMPELAIVVGGEVLNQKYHTRLGNYEYNPSADENLLDKEWDNLILLDACRYDYFAEHSNSLSGTLSKRISPGSTTKEFIRATFTNRHETDLVYVTTNSWWGRLAEEINSKVHKFINLEEEDIQDAKFDVEPPEIVADRAIQVSEKYPNKRLFVHFNQPHYPFIGETGCKVFPTQNRTTIRDDVARVNATVDEVRAAYEENLKLALPEVERLLNSLDGKTVVTADHGEMLGERGWPVPIRDYGHTEGIYLKELIEVPWLEYNADSEKRIIDQGVGTREANQEAVEERLQKLGYL